MSETQQNQQNKVSENENKNEIPIERRIFTHQQKEECWKKSQIMLGRHPDRWRIDPVGNPVLKHLKGCSGPLCHDYDHIQPYSKGGKTEIDNCQILQSGVNKFKSNKTDLTYEQLKSASPLIKFTIYDMDVIEKAIYGNVLKDGDKK